VALFYTYSGNVYGTGSAGQTTFALTSSAGNPIPYLLPAHIHVSTSINDQQTWVELARPADWDFDAQGTSVVLTNPLPVATELRVQRITPTDEPFVDFQASSLLTAEQLNEGEEFSLYVDQELRDAVAIDLAGALIYKGTVDLTADNAPLNPANGWTLYNTGAGTVIQGGTPGWDGIVGVVVEGGEQVIFDGAQWDIAPERPEGVVVVNGTAPITVDSTDPQRPVVGITDATTSAAGAMSAADKTKLDGIDTGAQANVWDRTGTTLSPKNAGDKVGVGTSSPSQLFTINGTGGGSFTGGYTNTLARINATTNTAGQGAAIALTALATKETAWIIAAEHTSGNNGDLAFYGYPGGVGYAERLRITAAGNVGIGTTSPSDLLHIKSTAAQLKIESSSGVNNCILYTNGATDAWRVGMNLALSNGSYEIYDDVNNVSRLVVDSSGRVGIGGITSPYSGLDIGAQSMTLHNGLLDFRTADNASRNMYIACDAANAQFVSYVPSVLFSSAGNIRINAGGQERARVDSSGRLLVGTTATSNNDTRAIIQGIPSGATAYGALFLAKGDSSPADGAALGIVEFSDSSHNSAARILAARDGGTWGVSTSHPSKLVFSTTADGASNPAERIRISQNGTATFFNGVNSPEETITAGAFDLAAGNFWTCGAIVIPNPTNAVAGMSGLIRLTAAPAGWGDHFSTAPAPTVFPSIVPFYVESDTHIRLGAAVGVS